MLIFILLALLLSTPAHADTSGKDPDLAKWLSKACSNGSRNACYDLALRKPPGAKELASEIEPTLRQKCQKKDHDICDSLGELYFQGLLADGTKIWLDSECNENNAQACHALAAISLGKSREEPQQWKSVTNYEQKACKLQNDEKCNLIEENCKSDDDCMIFTGSACGCPNEFAINRKFQKSYEERAKHNGIKKCMKRCVPKPHLKPKCQYLKCVAVP